jgi:hypothetical protein
MQQGANTDIDSLIESPWSMQDMQDFYDRIRALVRGFWVHPKTYWKEFDKMIAQKRIPTNGAYRDRNLNAGVGAETHRRIGHWCSNSHSRATVLFNDSWKKSKQASPGPPPTTDLRTVLLRH